jgi:hypothetical protein
MSREAVVIRRERLTTAEAAIDALRVGYRIGVREKGGEADYLTLGLFPDAKERHFWIEARDPLRGDWWRVGRMPESTHPMMWPITGDLLVDAARRLFDRYLLRGKLPETASIWRLTPS